MAGYLKGKVNGNADSVYGRVEVFQGSTLVRGLDLQKVPPATFWNYMTVLNQGTYDAYGYDLDQGKVDPVAPNTCQVNIVNSQITTQDFNP